MEENIELRLLGITYNQIESGVYALILESTEDRQRLAIVIGYPEAQSIECQLQKVRTPRPLSHDLLVSMLNALGASLLRVDIHRLPTGPYAGKLTIMDAKGDIIYLDARSSDAIAVAIRVGAPIFTSRKLLKEKGYLPQGTKTDQSAAKPVAIDSEWSKYSDAQLHDMLAQFVSEENYEKAAEVKAELERRKSQ